MQPQQPAPGHPANYDFILNPAPPPKKSPFGGGNSLAMRLLVVVGGLFVLVIVAAIVINLLGGGGTNKATLLTVAQDQTELIRLANRGKEDSVAQTLKNFSTTTALSLQTDKNELLTYSAERGLKPKDKDLIVVRSTDNDSQLDNAKSASNFDPTYKSLMQDELDRYQQDLTKAYNGTKNAEGKTLLQKLFGNAKLLSQELSS